MTRKAQGMGLNSPFQALGQWRQSNKRVGDERDPVDKRRGRITLVADPACVSLAFSIVPLTESLEQGYGFKKCAAHPGYRFVGLSPDVSVRANKLSVRIF